MTLFGLPQEVDRMCPLALHVGRYGEILRRSVGDVHKTKVGKSLGVTYRTIWGRTRDLGWGRPNGLGRERY